MIRQTQNRWLFLTRPKCNPREGNAYGIVWLGLLAVEFIVASPAAADNFAVNSAAKSLANSAAKSLVQVELEEVKETMGAVTVPLKPRIKENAMDMGVIAGLMFGTSVIERSPNEEAPASEAPASEAPNQEAPNQETPASELTKPPSKAPENVEKATYLLLSLSDRHLYLYKDGRVQGSYPVAIGRAGWETPAGTFTVIEKIQEPAWENPVTGAIVPAGSHNPLGSRWIGFWTDGTNYIGFHGTPNEEAIGQAVSHGCVRMRDRDIVALFELVGVGTTVKVQP